MEVAEVKRMIEGNGEVIVDCGNAVRRVELRSYKNATEAALVAMECAKHAPYVCCDRAGEPECDCQQPVWSDRFITD